MYSRMHSNENENSDVSVSNGLILWRKMREEWQLEAKTLREEVESLKRNMKLKTEQIDIVQEPTQIDDFNSHKVVETCTNSLNIDC